MKDDIARRADDLAHRATAKRARRARNGPGDNPRSWRNRAAGTARKAFRNARWDGKGWNP